MTAYTLFGRVVIRKEACSLYHQCLAIFILIEQRQILHEMNIINRSSHEHSVRCYYVEKAFVELSDKRKWFATGLQCLLQEHDVQCMFNVLYTHCTSYSGM